MMKKLMIAAAAVLAVCGCQTRVTAEKRAELMLPVYGVCEIGGTNAVYVAGYARGSGGWEASARSPLWANEQFAKLAACVNPDGTVSFGVDQYARDLSTNAVAMTQTLIDGAVQLAAKVAAAVATSGGSAAAEGAQSAIRSLVAKYVAAGGSAENAQITCKDGSCTITDGSVTCTDGSCYPSSN